MTRALHIAYVCADRGVPIGGNKGASVHVRALAQALASRGHRLSLLAANPGDRPPREFLPELHAIGYDRTLKRIRNRLANDAGPPAAARELYSVMLGGITHAKLAALDDEQPLDAIYERHSLWSWAALSFARQRGVPLLLEFNAPLTAEQARFRELGLEGLAAACERELVAGASALIAPSRQLEVHAAALGADPARIHLIPNAVDADLFQRPVERSLTPELPPGKFVIAFAGSLKPWHGLDRLIEIFPRLLEQVPEAHLLIVGDGPLGSRVRDFATEFGDDRVTAPGAVPHREIPAWLSLATIGVAPYPALEDFYFSPMKVVEYQAAGLAVVASEIGHIRRQIEHGRTGLLVSAGDDEALTSALAELARRPHLARRLGSRARQHVLEHATWSGVASQVERLIRRTTSRRSSETGAHVAGVGS